MAKTATEREREVLALLRKGMPNKRIAHALAISECTVKIHVRNLLTKADCTNRTQLAMSQLPHSPTPPEDPDNGSVSLAVS